MDGWIKVAKSEEVPENKGLSLHLKGEKIVIFRHGGKLFALKDFCPHQGAPLSHGFISQMQITCLYHGWKFYLEDGRFTGNEKLKIKTYAVKEKNGQILLNLDSVT